MKIGIDFDDILIDCNESVARYHNRVYGTSYKRGDMTTWHLHDIWMCSKEEAIRRVYEWYDSEEHLETLPIKGAIEAIAELSRFYELYIITSRPESAKNVTEILINRYFGDNFSGLHFTSHFESIGRRTKSEVCLELGTPILIEDSPVHAEEVANNGIIVLLLDAPWNKDLSLGNVFRVFSWKEIIRFLVSFQGQNIPSPCKITCNRVQSKCADCGRFLSEIKVWGNAPANIKVRAWRRILEEGYRPQTDTQKSFARLIRFAF